MKDFLTKARSFLGVEVLFALFSDQQELCSKGRGGRLKPGSTSTHTPPPLISPPSSAPLWFQSLQEDFREVVVLIRLNAFKSMLGYTTDRTSAIFSHTCVITMATRTELTEQRLTVRTGAGWASSSGAETRSSHSSRGTMVGTSRVALKNAVLPWDRGLPLRGAAPPHS